MSSTSLARRVLFARSRRRFRDRERTELALELSRVEPVARLLSEERRKLEEPFTRAMRQSADHVAQVLLGGQAVRPRRGDERENVAEALGVVVAGDEEPRFAADRDASQWTLGAVVVEGETTVVEKAHKRLLLPVRIAKRAAKRAALVADLVVFDLDPVEKGLDVRPQVGVPKPFDFSGWLLPPTRIELKDAPYARKAFTSHRVLLNRGLPELAPGMRPQPTSWRSQPSSVLSGGSRSASYTLFASACT